MSDDSIDNMCNIESLLSEFEISDEKKTNKHPIDKSNLIKESDVPLIPVVYKQLIAPLYTTTINFDEASIAWRSNKRIKNKHFYYICCHEDEDGSLCRNYINPPYETRSNTSDIFCYKHIRKLNNDKSIICTKNGAID
jgi:hypothetical protein